MTARINFISFLLLFGSTHFCSALDTTKIIKFRKQWGEISSTEIDQ